MLRPGGVLIAVLVVGVAGLALAFRTGGAHGNTVNAIQPRQVATTHAGVGFIPAPGWIEVALRPGKHGVGGVVVGTLVGEEKPLMEAKLAAYGDMPRGAIRIAVTHKHMVLADTPAYPRRALPLRFAAAAHMIRSFDHPFVARYELRATVHGVPLYIRIRFRSGGPHRLAFPAIQAELDRLRVAG